MNGNFHKRYKMQDIETSYRTVYEGGEGEYTEKKSRFLAAVRPVESEEEAISFTDEMKKKYWDASHNCSAWIIGPSGKLMRCSDDGEPGGTAGRPMLDVLAGARLCNVCAIVTRYFGGTLLGRGGLARAYSAAVQDGLSNCEIIEKKLAYRLQLTCDYADAGRLRYIAGSEGLNILSEDYGQQVDIMLLAPADDRLRIEKMLTEATGGRVSATEKGTTWFARATGRIVLFDH